MVTTQYLLDHHLALRELYEDEPEALKYIDRTIEHLRTLPMDMLFYEC